jgi:acetyltransferase
LAAHDIPFLLEYRKGFKALKALVDYGRFINRNREAGSAIEIKVDRQAILRKLAGSDGSLSERHGKEILAQYGIPTAREALARSENEALAIAERIGYPLVLKIESPQITHKTDARAVKTHISTAAELIRSYREILHNATSYDTSALIEGVLVQEMIGHGKEVLIGMTQDPQFGPVIAFGVGGVFVEMIQDVSLRAAPLNGTDAVEMIRELKSYNALKGARGEAESDIDAIVEILLRFSRLCMDLAGVIAAIDINPLMLLEKGKGAVAADCLMTRKGTIA